MQEASYYQQQAAGKVQCLLCPRYCRITDGETGFCRVRRNQAGRLYSENYSLYASCALDPIEKKPLYHFYPGSKILSLGTAGCNLSCTFCQNWQIAQASPRLAQVSTAQALQAAQKAQKQGNIGIAYTYSEPTVWYEYVFDTAQMVHTAGMKNVLITNGVIAKEPLLALLPWIDALNIDVKAFGNEFYQEQCGGDYLAVVQQTVELAVKSCHVEITNLIIPGLNDHPDEWDKLARWLSGLGKNIPLHFSRYFPCHKMTLPPTPIAVLRQARETASRYLSYVYIGNAGLEGTDTFCTGCGEPVLLRSQGRTVMTPELLCPYCGTQLALCGELRGVFAGTKEK